MGTYQQTLRRIQPAIKPFLESMKEGLKYANALHGPEGFERQRDPHYWSHAARRRACDELNARGLEAQLDSGPGPMSSILMQYNGVWMWVLRPEVRHDRELIPLPGTSPRRQSFWRQDPVLDDLGGVVSDNILVLWQDNHGELREPLGLVRPLGGDHLRRNLQLDWEGPLRADMADLRAADLDGLQPSVIHPRLGDETG